MVGTRDMFSIQGKAMPKILPTFAAIAVIGICIAVNTARYPIVWEMVGPNGQLSFSEKSDPTANNAAMDSSVKTESSTSAAANSPQPPETKREKPVELAETPSTKEDMKSPLPKAVPVALPAEEPPANDMKKDAESAKKSESPESNVTPTEEVKLVEPPRPLVPVVKGSLIADLSGALHEVRRLPPLDAEMAVPNGGYAVENLSSSIPIYPSTGE